ncbi:TspO/MBR family protein [Adlercreutzia sp. ZJ473]|uniref:TspO/MBR family protein n=1 Tax=Adlercreutzia sp. ZJ473 TaxID=2722822 RepID=UPI001557CFE5|nr:TspO/MBR family protein [Adlercreutzia sp. ZJ473]
MRSSKTSRGKARASSSGAARWLRGVRRYLTPSVAAMWVAYAVMVLCNGLFEALRLGGTTSSEMSNQVFAWFTPAGYVFAIWGAIYLALFAWLAYATWGTSPATRARRTGRAGRGGAAGAQGVPGGRSATALFVASCVLNVAWLALFHFGQTAVALVVIAALWVDLAALYAAVRRDGASGRAGAPAGAGLRERAMAALGWAPISLYAAWATVAVIANASHVATRMAGEGVPLVGELSTLVLAAGVLLLGYFMRSRYADGVMQAVFLWAIVGVGVHVLDASPLVAVMLFVLAAFGAVVTYVPADALRALRAQAAAR